MKLSKRKQAYADFRQSFETLCKELGGVFSADDTYDPTSPNYRFQTPFGVLRVSIHDDSDYSRHPIEGIYMQFRDYKGPSPFPLHGDFNRCSHKWNITVSAATLDKARSAALSELRIRLELLKGEAVCPS